MKKKLFILFALATALVSCSDKIYEEINTDYTKSDVIEPSMQLSYAALQLYGDMNYVDVYRLYTYAFTQHLMGCWNTTNYGGQHRVDDQEMGRPWNNLYSGAMRNLTDGIYRTDSMPDQANINAAMRIFRVYVGGLLTDFYGDIPYTEAGLAYINGNSKPKYDEQKDLYPLFIKELKEAAKLFDVKAEAIKSDPIFQGDIEKWKTFANSLRLRYAMRVSEVMPDSAKAWFNEAKDEAMSSTAENACVEHLKVRYSFGQESYKDFRGNALSKYFFGNDPANNPTYICKTFWDKLYDTNDPRTLRLCRFYIDDFMTISTGEGRIDVTDAVIATQQANPDKKIIGSNAPGDFSWDDWPSYDSLPGSPLVAVIDTIRVLHPKFDPTKNPRWLKPKLAENFLRSENPGMLMTYAEVCFLRAEAAVKGWNGDNAKDYYETGIRAAMDLYSDYYDCARITDAEYAAFLSQPAITFGAATAQQLSQINTQAWILHFHNPAEAWANVRRSNLPQLADPTPAVNPLIDGTQIPVRLCYPLKEETYNIEEYKAAIDRVTATGVGYDWHAPLWWDK
jgi:hypothetical protein